MAVTTSTSAQTNRPRHRVLDIEEALRWAYVHELPKRRHDPPLVRDRHPDEEVPLPMQPMWRAGVFGARIDNWTKDPGFPLAMGDPHPDALRIEAAVDALDDAILDLAPYQIAAGLGAHVDLAWVESITRRDVRSWLVTFARSGKRPSFHETAEFEPVRGANGKAVIWETVSAPCGEGPNGEAYVTTYDRQTGPVRAGQYPDGAFCKLHWLHSAEDVAEDRCRWALWHAALAALAEVLAPVLQEMAVTAPRLPMRPWAEAMPAGPTVRPSTLRRPAPLEARRPVALRQPPRAGDPGRSVPRGEWPDRYRSA